MAFVFIVALLLVFSNLYAADAPDTSTTPADSLKSELSQSDTLGIEEGQGEGVTEGIEEGAETEAVEEEAQESSGAEESLQREATKWWSVHPKSSVSIKKQKDVAKWESKISLNQRLNERITLRLDTSIQTRENTTLNRSDSDDATTANLNYRVSDDLALGITYNSTVSARRFSLHGGGPGNRRKKESFKISSDFNHSLSDAVSVRLKAAAGTTENLSSRIRNKGTSQNLSASVSYSPSEDLSTSIAYNGKHLLLDSRIDSAGTALFSSQDRTLTQNLSVQATYKFIPGISISLDASQNDYQKQHPDPKENAQETEKGSGRSASVSSSFNLWEKVTWDLSVSFDETRKTYKLNTSRNSFVRNSDLQGSARIMPWKGATLNVGGERKISRGEYETQETGNDIHKSLTLKLTQDLGPKANLSITALSDLVSISYDDKVANPKDRDRQSNRISFNLDYNPLKKITTKFGGEYSVDQSVYIKASSSANNRTTRKYRVSGSYKISTFKKITVIQDYDISAVYTFYHFAESKNSLVRNSNVKTRLNFPITQRLKITLSHTYKHQDQGNYRESGGARYYARSNETESHSLNFGFTYRLLKKLRIMARQGYFLQRNWRFKNGNKQLDYVTANTEIMGRIGFTYEIGDRTKFSLKIEQHRKEGERVNEAFKSYRNVEFEASHVF